MKYDAIAFVATQKKEVQDSMDRLVERYGQVPPADADVIVALGGDGQMLKTLHSFMGSGVPIYGMNRGSIGFLMNVFHEDDLKERLEKAEPIGLHPLRMKVVGCNGEEHQALAINEVSLLRQTAQAAKIRIEVDGVVRLDELVCDGALVSTPAGSTAYNNAVYGPILPLGAELLALTPIGAFRPRRWRGALLPRTSDIVFHVLEAERRQVSAVADFTEVRDIARVEVCEDADLAPTLLFDPEHNLDERILKEQFVP